MPLPQETLQIDRSGRVHVPLGPLLVLQTHIVYKSHNLYSVEPPIGDPSTPSCFSPQCATKETPLSAVEDTGQ